MKNYTVQYQKVSWDGIRNVIVSAENEKEAEDKARKQEKNIQIVRVFENNNTHSSLHTTQSFRKVPTPANEFKI